MTPEPYTPAMFLSILPEILLVGLAGLIMLSDLVWPESRKRGLGLLTSVGFGVILVVALIFSRPTAPAGNPLIFGGMIRDDFAAFFFRIMFLFSGAAVA